MYFVYAPDGISPVQESGHPMDEVCAMLATDYPECIYFEAELAPLEEPAKSIPQCCIALDWQKPNINICILEAEHEGRHETYGLGWNTITYSGAVTKS